MEDLESWGGSAAERVISGVRNVPNFLATPSFSEFDHDHELRSSSSSYTYTLMLHRVTL